MAALGGAGGPAAEPYKIVGSGTFGSVIKPALSNTLNGVLTVYPNNVTKIFYKEKYYNNAVKAVNKVHKIMNLRSGPNAGHAANAYTKKYKGRNLPKDILTRIQIKEPEITNDTNLHLMRMPDLGVDFNTAVYTPSIIIHLQHIPFPTILKQIVKLIQQTSSLAGHDHGHFDIRESNVMIHPRTGIMTIIDFDWLKSFHEFKATTYTFGFYNNPPECLLYKKWERVFLQNTDGSYIYNYDAKHTPSVKKFIDINQLEDYAKQQHASFFKYYKELGLAPENIFRILYYQFATDITSFRDLYDSDDHALSSEIFDIILQSYDAFSLGLTLLNLLVTIYPTIVQDEDKHNIIERLKPLLKNGDELYTDAQFEIIVNSLKEIIDTLKHMCSFSIKNRVPPDIAVNHAEAILDECMAVWNPDVAPVAAAPAAPAAPAGGGRKRTRRTRVTK